MAQTFAIRFALAYLWSLAPSSREPFDGFWRALIATDMWRFSAADQTLNAIYRQLRQERDDEVGMQLWRRCAAAREAKEAAGPE